MVRHHPFPSRQVVAALLGFAGLATSAAQAQETDTFTEVSPAEYARMFNEPAGSAAASFGAPLAFGASWGDVGAGIYTQTVRGLPDKADGSAGLTVGFGDGEDAVGLEASVAFSSLLDGSNASGGFGDAGSLAFKLHTALPGQLAFAVGVSSVGRWGSDNDAQKAATFVAISKMVQVPLWGDTPQNLMLNAGIGNQSYNKFRDYALGGFGSVALFFTPQFSAIVDYSGTVLKSALSWAPFLTLPLTIDVGVVNLNGAYNGDPEAAASIGYGFQF